MNNFVKFWAKILIKVDKFNKYLYINIFQKQYFLDKTNILIKKNKVMIFI